MPEEKRYYWLKLKRDFFKRHDVRIIESMPNGKDYLLFYLKMLVESIDHNGTLRFSDTLPYNEEMLAVITNTNVDIVKGAMNVFVGLQLIEILDDKTIYMQEIDKMVGSECDSAERVRRLRAENERKLLQCNADVTECNTPVTKCNIEKEIELDKESDKDKETDKDCICAEQGSPPDDSKPVSVNGKYPVIYSDVINYLNEKAGTAYKPTSKSTQKHIRARQAEGFTLEDFKKVIDFKCAEWSSEPKMKQYLRPETLFSIKFEWYLNNPKLSDRRTDLDEILR